ncbi:MULTISPECIES: type IV secretion system protein TraC [Betaproteobacteria]|jgi:conjugal transfer ATP-binding protein TraC|uniref:Type IV secretion system protein TraC n=1 Tax=Acidovorax facilis TaxID=12917 RepID=A0ABV8D8P7_9BURK|nr:MULTISPECIES: type IV secretion system protein TraC [Acidovorax]KQB59143.1 conjugal transfer protein TraC [Acidovorax sp. SD340]MBO1006740.1 type IV secretion system protein TraC [Acidovorax sp. SD340]MCO4240247.1 type IV secretion system protein TraC [Acidovorax facilis]
MSIVTDTPRPEQRGRSDWRPLNLPFGLGVSPDTPAEQFASWLPYMGYLDAECIFANRDGMGFMLELMPQSGADDRMTEVLVSLYANCPAGTGLQFHLFASPHIRSQLRRYANLRVEDEDQFEKAQHWGRPARNENLFRALARQRVGHLLEGAQQSLTAGFHYTIRDFRLMLSVAFPADPGNLNKREELLALRDSMASTLRSASLPNRVCDAADLINWCAIFTNPDRMSGTDAPDLNYDDGRELRDQIVDFDTIQDPHPSGLTFWKESGPDVLEARFYSIKSFPERFALWQMGSLIGDLMQPALQYSAPFLLTLGVQILDPNATKSVVTANHVRATQNAKSKMADVMPDVRKKLDDWTAAADAIDTGGNLVSLYHQLAIFSTPEKAAAAHEAASAIWRSRGFQLNADAYMHRQALLASLPMTLTERFHKDLAKMRRVTRKTMSNAIHMAPLIAEWRGTRTPALVFGGRRGQLMTLDLFDNDLGNYNFAIIGAPGSGKSVLMNEMAWSYRAIGAKVWMLDLGRSFEKLCRKARGTYIEFKPDVDICLNPFSIVQDINEDIDMLVPGISKMCSMQHALEEVQYKAISAMVLKLWREYGQDLTITGLRDAFRTGSLEELGAVNDQRIKDLAIMLNPYAKGGQYERFFEGRANVDFSNDFIVIENEELKRRPDLHAVVNILLLHQITGEMYLTRNRRKVLFIDELKQQLGDIGADDPVKAAVVEEAARRARKYGGALGTATQSADDYYGSAQMEAAFNCSDWVFLLRQKPESIEMLDRKGRLTMDEPKKRLLNSLRTEAGAFSELYISSPVGEGVARNILDPATHLLFSNKLEDNAPIDELRARGYSIDEAIAELLRQRGHAL